MQRIEIKHSVKRLVSGGALLALTLAQPALADDTKNEASRAGDQQHTEKVRVSSTLSGLSRDQIKDVQRELASRGLYQGSIDGVPGAKTESALKNFQTQQGLAVGSIDAKTRDALGLEWSMETGRAQPSKVSNGKVSNGSGSAQPMTATEQQRMRGSDSQPARKQPVRGTDVDSTSTKQPVQAASTGAMSTGTEITSLSEDQRKRMQQVLKDEGFYQGEVDGVVGAQTRAALQRYFQRQSQLAAQGRITEGSIEGFDKH
jgi:peptidoglycan hydrolase-like protein with peptidoglycan-binding domain